MKLMYLPTLSEMRDMLGEELYVKFVWMWREQDQDTRALERRAKFAAALPKAAVHEWPTPVFARVEERVPVATSEPLDERRLPSPAQALQAALLRAPRLADGIELPQFERVLERANGFEDEPREVAMAAGGRRRRR